METYSVTVSLDIETVPHETAEDYLSNVKVSAPSTWKDKDKIKQREEENRSKLLSKAALTWYTGKVFSFAVSPIDGSEPVFFYSLDEKEVLKQISKVCSGKIVYAKSGKLFDYPFLIGRYLSNEIVIPQFLKDSTSKLDVDDFFSYSSANPQRSSLEAYAHGLGISGKSGDFGIVGKVYNALMLGDCKQEDIDELKQYNIQDAVIVSEMVRRYRGQYGDKK